MAAGRFGDVYGPQEVDIHDQGSGVALACLAGGDDGAMDDALDGILADDTRAGSRRKQLSVTKTSGHPVQ